MSSERVLLDTTEAAEIVFNGKKSKNAIQRAVRLGQIPSCRIGGRIFLSSRNFAPGYETR